MDPVPEKVVMVPETEFKIPTIYLISL